MNDGADDWEAAVLQLFAEQPVRRLVQIGRVDFDVAARRRERPDDEGGQPQRARVVTFAERRIRVIVVPILELALVTCPRRNPVAISHNTMSVSVFTQQITTNSKRCTK